MENIIYCPSSITHSPIHSQLTHTHTFIYKHNELRQSSWLAAKQCETIDSDDSDEVECTQHIWNVDDDKKKIKEKQKKWNEKHFRLPKSHIPWILPITPPLWFENIAYFSLIWIAFRFLYTPMVVRHALTLPHRLRAVTVRWIRKWIATSFRTSIVHKAKRLHSHIHRAKRRSAYVSLRTRTSERTNDESKSRRMMKWRRKKNRWSRKWTDRCVRVCDCVWREKNWFVVIVMQAHVPIHRYTVNWLWRLGYMWNVNVLSPVCVCIGVATSKHKMRPS